MGKARKPVQVIILLLVVLLGGYAVGTSVFGGGAKPEAGSRAPSFKLLGLDGETHTMDEYKDKAIVLNFWGTWCGPCVKEMPALQAQYEKWSKEDVVVVGVNVAEDRLTVENFVSKLGVKFPILLDTGRDAVRSYGISPLPATFFIRPGGKIDTVHIGQLDLDTLDRQIGELVNR